jgi:formate C-acetyltransferase
MYQFAKATDRILHMRQLIRDRVIQQDAERMLIATEENKKIEHVVPIIKRPMLAKAICERMTCRVEDFELIVGNKGKTFCGSGSDPQWSAGGFYHTMVDSGYFTLREDGLYHNPDSDEVKLAIAPEDVELMKQCAEYWKDKTIGLMAEAWQPDGYEEFASLQASSYGNGMPILMIPTGHLIPGWKKILNVGYGAIRKQAQDWLDSHRGNLMGEDMNRYMFYKSAVIACDGVMTLAKRYGDACAEKAAAEQKPARKKELEMMADGLYNLSENPARTFWEACQGTIIYQLFLGIAGGYPAPAFGRFDQYTWPYLKKDLEEGRLTLKAAQEIVDAFFLKANCFYSGGLGRLAQTTGIGNTYQHTTIGGVIPETGEDATNPVTYMVLETVGRLLLHDPTISLRIHKNTPQRLWDCAIETSRLVGGLPLFQNDEVIVPGLMRELGFSLRDARDYGIIGCQEIVGSGNDYPAPNGVHAPHASLHYGTVLAIALNNGVNPYNGRAASLKTGYLYEMKSIEEVREAFKKMAAYLLKWHVTINNYTEYISTWLCTHADLSISMEGCMESGKDCVHGGCKYNSYGGTATGLATIADSLTTIKYMCFDHNYCTTKELYEAVMANWVGYEALRQRIISEVPHFGNGDPYADMEMKWCIDTYYELCQDCGSVRTPIYKAGLYGAADHIAQGYTTWATPDGRRLGEPLADAASPAQSRDKNGPTAVFNSSLVYDQSRFMDGIALNLRIHPSAVNTEAAKQSLINLTKSYFEDGGLEVQYNIISAETMKAAQSDPNTYRDLVVRIAGYSAYFVELGKDLQNDLISRTENGL